METCFLLGMVVVDTIVEHRQPIRVQSDGRPTVSSSMAHISATAPSRGQSISGSVTAGRVLLTQIPKLVPGLFSCECDQHKSHLRLDFNIQCDVCISSVGI